MMSEATSIPSIMETETTKRGILTCRQCSWSFWIISDPKINKCPNCFSQIIDRQIEFDSTHLIQFLPELVISPTVDNRVLDSTLSSFIKGIPFKPPDLSISNIKKRRKLLFLPMWLVDCSVIASWESETGFIYQVISHQDIYNDNSNQWKSQAVTEQRTRWEKRIGKINRAYQNIPAPALEEAGALKKKIGDPQLAGLQQYSPNLIEHSPIRLPDRSTKDAWNDAALTLTNLAANDVKIACSADYMRGFKWQPEISQQNWSLLLYPLFTSYYLDDDHRPQVILIHGQTGKIAGVRKASMKRAKYFAIIMMIISICLFLSGLITGAASLVNPIFTPLAIILVVLSGLLALGGFFAVGLAWQHNRKADR